MPKISNSIPSQLSGTVRQNYPRFVEFLKAYYEWLENPDNPYYHIRNHLSFLDFEKSLQDYVDQMKKEYLFGLPESILGNSELFIKYAKQFNLSIGSEKSFNFVFNMLFGEDIQIDYPKDDILRTSDGRWIGDEFLMYITAEKDPQRFVSQKIKQIREVGPNEFEEAEATVLRAKSRFVARYKFSEIIVKDISGTFDFDYPIYLEGNPSDQEWFMPVGTQFTINDGGINYRQGDRLKLSTNNTYDVTRNAQITGRFDTRITSDFNGEVTVIVDGNTLASNEFTFDGRIVNSTQIASGDSVTVKFPIYEGFIIVSEVGNTLGDIQSINIIDPPIGIDQTYSLDTSEGGSGANIDISRDTTKLIPGYFRSDYGFLSSTKVLQDGNFYQEYSYVIKSSQTIDKYRDVVLDVLHPAGMKLFGQINIKFLIDLMIRDIQFDITFKPPLIVIESEENVSLGPTTSFFDRMKCRFDPELVTADNYKDLVVGDVISTPLKRYNIADSFYQSICRDVYVDEAYYEQGYICEGADDIVNCIDDYTDPNYYKFGYICDANP